MGKKTSLAEIADAIERQVPPRPLGQVADELSRSPQPPFVQPPPQGANLPGSGLSTGSPTSLVGAAPSGPQAPTQFALPEENDPLIGTSAPVSISPAYDQLAQESGFRQEGQRERALYHGKFADMDRLKLDKYRNEILPQERGALKTTEVGLRADADALRQSAAEIEQMRAAGDPAYPQAVAGHNQLVASFEKQLGAYEDMARSLDREERVLGIRDYEVRSQTGSKTGAYWNNALNFIGESISGFNSPIVDLMLAVDPVQPKEGETQDAANNRLKERLRAGMREAPTEMIGSKGTTNEFIERLGRSNFFHEAALGATGSIPTFFMGPGGMGMMTAAMDNADAQLEGPEYDDVPQWKKRAFSATVGAVTGKLEQMGMRNAAMNRTLVGRLLRDAAEQIPPGATPDQITTVLRREVDARAINDAMNSLVGGASEEAITEGAQSLAENSLKDAFNVIEGRQLFDTGGFDGYVTDAFRSMAAGAIGGAMYAGPGAVSRAMRGDGLGKKTTPEEFEMVEALVQDPVFDTQFNEQQDRDVEDGKITPEQAEQVKTDFALARKIRERIPDDLPTESRKEAFDILVAIEKLKAKDPNLVATKVEALKQKLRDLEGVPQTPEPKLDAEGKATEPEPVQPTGKEAQDVSLLPDTQEFIEPVTEEPRQTFVSKSLTQTPEENAIQVTSAESVPVLEAPGGSQEVRGPYPEGSEVAAEGVIQEGQVNEPVSFEADAGGTVVDAGGNDGVARQGIGEEVPTQAPPPQEATPGLPDEAGQVKKTISTKRSYEGGFRDEVKAEIEKLGLTREVENQEQAIQRADDLIASVGVDAALGAARARDVQGGAATTVYIRAMEDLNNRILTAEDDATRMELARELATINQELDARQVSSGRESSILNVLYQTSNLAFNADRMAQRWRDELGQEIPSAEMERLRALDKSFAELQKKLAEAEERAAKAEESATMAALKESVKRRRFSPKTNREAAGRIAAQIRSLKVGNKMAGAFVVPPVILDGALELAATTIEAGGSIADAVARGLEAIRSSEWYQKLVDDEKAQAEKAFTDPLSSLEETAPGPLRIPVRAIREAVESGANDLNSLIQALKPAYPTATDREIRDAITGYGKTVEMTRDQVSSQLARMRSIGRLMSKLEDLQAKVPLQKSQSSREKMSKEERALKRQIAAALEDIPLSRSEAERRAEAALDTAKTRTRDKIERLQKEIADKKKGEKQGRSFASDPELQRLEAEAQALQDIHSSLFSTEDKVRNIVNAIQRSIKELERRIQEKDLTPKTSGAPVSSPEIEALRGRLEGLRAAYAQAQEDAGVFEAKRLQTAKDALKRSIAELERRLKEGDFSKRTRKELPEDKDLLRLQMQKDRLRDEYNTEFEKEKLRQRTFREKTYDRLAEAVGMPKSLLASLDLSAPLRQGAVLSAGNPRAAGRATAEMFRHAFSEKKAEEWLAKLKQTEDYRLMRDSKLYLAEPSSSLTAKEEQFMSNWAERIPVVGRLVKGSNRAYSGYLNKLRSDVFMFGANQMMDQGITPKSNPEAYKEWARFINNATGRGKLPTKAAESAVPFLNALFFSPRFLASRFNLLDPTSYNPARIPGWEQKGDKKYVARRMAARNMLSFLAFFSVVSALLVAAGGEDEKDPRDTDFGKIRFGDTRYDFGAGFAQVLRFLARFITGETSKDGKVTKLDGKKFPFHDRGDVATSFVRSKLSPLAGSAVNLATGEDMIGQEATWDTELLRNVVPLVGQEMYSTYQKEGATGAMKTLPSFFGVGVQTYKKREPDVENPPSAPPYRPAPVQSTMR